MIDSHCHLADRAFSKDLDAVIERAQQAGITTLVTIADSLKEGEKCLGIVEMYDQIFCTAGVHPHVAKNWEVGDEERLQSLITSSEKAKAVGEIGLDYYYDSSPRDVQRDVFRIQLEIAKELGLPAVIHCREAIDDLRRIVEEVQPEKAVLHCCAEKWKDVEEWVGDGYLLSFTGIATYPKAEDIRHTILQCPLEQMMVETDAPYLSPVPHRGKRNEPAFVLEVAKLIAQIKGISLEEVDRVTTENAVEFFHLPS